MANEEITVGMGINTGPFHTGLRQARVGAEAATDLIKESFRTLGQSFAGIISAEGISRLAEFADNIKRTAETAGVSTDFVQHFDRVVQSVGGDTESANEALNKLAGFMGQAFQQITAESAQKFTELGISLIDAHGNAKSTEQVLRDLAERIKDSKSATEATALVMDIWGSKIGGQLIPILKEGSAGLDKFNDSVTLTTQDINTLIEAKANIQDFFTTIEVWAGKAIGAVAKLAQLLGIIVEKMKEAGGFKGDVISNPLGAALAFKNALGPARIEYENQQADQAKDFCNEIQAQKPPGAAVTRQSLRAGAALMEQEENATWKELIDAYKNAVTIQKKKNDKAEETEQLQDQYDHLIRQQHEQSFEESQRGALYPTVQELANNRGPFNAIARQILMANQDQIRSRANLWIDRAEGDRQFAQQRLDYLAASGVINPEDYERHQMAMAAQDTAAAITKLLDKATTDGIHIKPVMAP